MIIVTFVFYNFSERTSNELNYSFFRFNLKSRANLWTDVSMNIRTDEMFVTILLYNFFILFF